jgi:hypothetical protein
LLGETPEQVIASLTTGPEETGFARMPRTAEEALNMVAVGRAWMEANIVGAAQLTPKPIGSFDEFMAAAEANGIKTIHDLPGLIPALLATEPAEPMIRFCPGCGSVGTVDEKFRDCCPDGVQARMIPEPLAKRCHNLFSLALDAVCREGKKA